MSAFVPAFGEKNPDVLITSLRGLAEGRSNAVGTVTLAANVTTTVVTAINCGAESRVFLFQTTPNAAAEIGNGTIHILAANVTRGSFTITHANSAQTDRTFFYFCVG